ncbi:FAD-dependent monooxygenase [Streptomyces xanthochromogenes]|uniref:FAD-dependent monooxygenase n=1 Tax=Streptomyces xanthochromogenes TaxID=67384 RepID=UPI003431D517
MAESADVLIVGAGPVGLTLAIELLNRGTSVRVIEQSERPHPHSKAIILWPRGLEALGRLGVADEILSRGLIMRAQNYHSGGRRVARMAFAGLRGTRHPYALSLPQEQTEAVLREKFRSLGGSIDFGVRLESVRQDGDGVLADLDDNGTRRQARHQWLVGCDGAHSTVRKSTGVAFTGASYPQQFLLADGACATSLAHDEAHYFMTAAGVLVVVGLPGGLYRVFVSVAPDTELDDPLRLIQEAASARCPVPIELTGEQRTGVFRVHRRAAERFRTGRVLLAGDAAHIHSPAGGQGLNTGIEDASSLGWRLAGVVAGSAPESVLDTWEKERLHVAGGVVADTDRQTRMWMMRGWRRRLRDLVLSVGQRSGWLDRVVVPRQAQLTLAYPGSRQARGELAVGRRLPDVALPRGGRLHDLVEGPTLLLFEAPGATATGELAARARRHGLTTVVVGPAVSGGVHDPDGTLNKALGLGSATAAVVRPDAVVAWASRADDAGLAPWLRQEFPAPRPGAASTAGPSCPYAVAAAPGPGQAS